MESEESLGYHWGSWLGEGIQPLDGLTEGDEVSSLEPSLLLSLAGESAASSPAAGTGVAAVRATQTNERAYKRSDSVSKVELGCLKTDLENSVYLELECHFPMDLSVC